MSFPLIQHISELRTLPPEHSCFDCWFLFAFLPALLPFFGLFFHLLLLLFWVICWHNSALALVVIVGDCCCVQVQRRTFFFVLDMWTPKLPSILFLRSQAFSVRMFSWCEVACTELFQWAPAGVDGGEGHAVNSFFLFSASISLLWSDLCSPPRLAQVEAAMAALKGSFMCLLAQDISQQRDAALRQLAIYILWLVLWEEGRLCTLCRGTYSVLEWPEVWLIFPQTSSLSSVALFCTLHECKMFPVPWRHKEPCPDVRL